MYLKRPHCGSSADCKRCKSVLDPQWGRVYNQTSRAAKFKTKSREGHGMILSLTWQVYGLGVGAHNYGYNRRTLARSVSIEQSVYRLPFVDVENKNYGKRNRGTPSKKNGLFQMTDIRPRVGTG